MQKAMKKSWPVNRGIIKELLLQVDGLLPNSWLELQALRQDLQWHGETFEIAHYGVDPGLFLDPDPHAFREATGIRDPFVLQAGRIEPAKNQAMLCWALRETNIPIVLIGASKHWPAYAELCKKISGERLHIIEHVPQRFLHRHMHPPLYMSYQAGWRPVGLSALKPHSLACRL